MMNNHLIERIDPLTGSGNLLAFLEVFTSRLDARPRPVVSAEYVGREVESLAPRPRPAHYSTNEGAAAGRLVLVLVDRGSISRGGVRRVQEGADRFLSTLAAADRVGLVTLPGPPPSVEFTEDHVKVRRALNQVVDGLREYNLSQRAAAMRGDRAHLQLSLFDPEPDGLTASLSLSDPVAHALTQVVRVKTAVPERSRMMRVVLTARALEMNESTAPLLNPIPDLGVITIRVIHVLSADRPSNPGRRCQTWKKTSCARSSASSWPPTSPRSMP